MTSQTGQQIITIYIYIYIYGYIYLYIVQYLKKNGHWKMKFGQLIEYNMTNIFLKN